MKNFPTSYTDFAKYYDRLESQYRDYPLEANWLDAILEKRSTRNVIGIRCGTASHTSLVEPRQGGPRKNYFAMDPRSQMIENAKAKIRRSTSEQSSFPFARADFLSSPFRDHSFDVAICMYLSIAGLDYEGALVRKLFSETRWILRNKGILVFDTEYSDGIKRNLLSEPFIDSFFQYGDENSSRIIRFNHNRLMSEDTVDCRSFYLIETSGDAELQTDRMKLRFCSMPELERLLEESGFRVLQVPSGQFKDYEKNSPSLYFSSSNKRTMITFSWLSN